MTIAPDELAARCRAIELLVLDVDGVLTDGVIAVDDNGVETKNFFVRDGSAIVRWRNAGGHVAILSGRSARCVDIRAGELGIAPVVLGAAEKGVAFLAIVDDFGLYAHQACFMGDDTPDLPALALAGLPACPADAAAEVVAACGYVANAPGGRGAVREVVDLILGHRGAGQAPAAP